MLGSFCSRDCLAAAEALAMLQNWGEELDAHGRFEQAEARETLAEQLLLLWRRRAGPNPATVIEAVQLARGRDAGDSGGRTG